MAQIVKPGQSLPTGGKRATAEHSILYLSTFPPRKCGLATFTADLVSHLEEIIAPAACSKIVAINPNDVASYVYPRKVVYQIVQDRQEDYLLLARRINRMGDVRLVNIQHEFGIFGGEWGDYLIPFLERLRKPKVINFHTVMPNPEDHLRRVVQAIGKNVNAITVMTQRSRQILLDDYAVEPAKIRVIPHGIHPQPFLPNRPAKAALGYSDRVVFSTFGLLNRNKGLEYVIEALPEVIKRYPNFVYIYFGATHPMVAATEGESYRQEIIDRIYRLGLFDHVRLYNRFFPLGELLRFLRATDVYISPGLEPEQAVSGTLSYALGMGRPVISTAFANARELLTEDVGILVPFRDPQAYAAAMIRMLEDEELRLQMGRNAYFKTRWMTWPNVAVRQLQVFAEHSPALRRIARAKALPKIKLDHLIRLTDDYGIVQFAKLTHPDRRSGYTLDDNARALAATATYYGGFAASRRNPLPPKQRQDLLRLIRTYLGFIRSTAHPEGYFVNFVRPNRTLDLERNLNSNLEDANSRALLGLAKTAATGSLPPTIRREALELLEWRCRGDLNFGSPRAVARWIKALCILIEHRMDIPGLDLERELHTNCAKLIECYRAASSADWKWFEEVLAYSNGVMPEALFKAYHLTGRAEYLEMGREALDFLVKLSFTGNMHTPVGQAGWHQRHGAKSQYDQQPEEVKSMVCALLAAYQATGEHRYQDLMRIAFSWFLGDNSLNQVIYDRSTGGCYDGVGPKAVNLNQGAESTISYLLARLAFERIEARRPRLRLQLPAGAGREETVLLPEKGI